MTLRSNRGVSSGSLRTLPQASQCAKGGVTRISKQNTLALTHCPTPLRKHNQCKVPLIYIARLKFSIPPFYVTPDDFPTICGKRQIFLCQKMRRCHCRSKNTNQNIYPDRITACVNYMFYYGTIVAKNFPRLTQKSAISFITSICVLIILEWNAISQHS